MFAAKSNPKKFGHQQQQADSSNMKLLGGCGCRPAVALVAAMAVTALVNISSIHSFGIGGEPPVSLLTSSANQPTNRRDGGRRRAIGEMLLLTTTAGLVLGNPRTADAAALLTATKADDAMSTINVWLDRLETIPVFCIVDQTSGANYMLVKQDQGMAIGYAFTTFAGALTVLSEAQKTAQEKNYYDVWENATVTTIPMSIAIRLALKKRVRTTPKEQTLDSIVLMIPGVVCEYMIDLLLLLLLLLFVVVHSCSYFGLVALVVIATTIVSVPFLTTLLPSHHLDLHYIQTNQNDDHKQDEQQDGIALDSRFKDQGQVPLFYVLGPEQQSSSSTTTISSSNDNEYSDDAAIPLRLYFTRQDLLRSWTAQHPGEPGIDFFQHDAGSRRRLLAHDQFGVCPVRRGVGSRSGTPVERDGRPV
jgi:hypothetical protein